MTLVQASICEKGNTIILIADRMVSYSIGGYIEYEKEGNTSKLFVYNKNAIGFAGILPDIVKIKNKIEPKDNVDDFLDEIIEIMIKNKNGELNRSILNDTIWKNKEEFIKNLNICPNDLKDLIFGKNAEFRLQLNCLIVGFNKKNEAKIYTISNEYEVNDVSDLFHHSIGSGTPFSVIFFDQENYDVNFSLEEGLYFAYRAKKTAESHTGVGIKTDIVIIRKNDKPIIIFADDEKMKMLENLYQDEKQKNINLRREIIKKIDLEEVKKNV